MKFLTIAAKELRLFRRDRMALFWVIVLPIILIVLFSAVFAPRPVEISVLVVQEDNSPAADAYVSALDNILDIVPVDDAADAEDRVRAGEYVVAIIIPADFGEQLLVGASTVHLVYDEVRETTARIVIQIVDGVTRRFLGQDPPITLEARSVHGREFDPFQHFVPGIGIFFIMMGMGAFGASCIHVEREEGTLRRNLLAPIGRTTFLGGKLLGGFLIGCVQITILFGVGILVFGMVIEGSIPLVALISAFVVLLGMGLGLAIARFIRSGQAAEGTVQALVLPMSFLSGLWWPIELMPQYLQSFAQVLPMTHAMSAFNDIIMRGQGLLEIAPSLAVLAGFAIALFVIGVLFFRWEGS
jgi:ABC-2 type transport system permease protein